MLIVYGVLNLVAIVILVSLGATNVLSWGTLYAWLVAMPFGIISIVGFTFIPDVLTRYAKQPKTNQKNWIMVLGVFLYILRYLMYVIPILIVAGVNGFKLEGIFDPFGAIACVILIPICGLILNFVLFQIDLKKEIKKGDNSVPTGDSLRAN